MDNTGTTANKLLVYDGSGNLPAVDGSQLTNISTCITESTNDPTVSTNPAGGVGTEWHNTSTGEVYVLTDATAGANVWMNVGEGSGDVEPWAFQGESYGYSSGGYPYPSGALNTIDKFSFATDGNATDVGDLTVARGIPGGQSSTTHGYCAGGIIGGPPFDSNYIDKFTFASDANATDVGDLSVSRASMAGQSTADYAYASGGDTAADSNVILVEPSETIVIQFKFASMDANPP